MVYVRHKNWMLVKNTLHTKWPTHLVWVLAVGLPFMSKVCDAFIYVISSRSKNKQTKHNRECAARTTLFYFIRKELNLFKKIHKGAEEVSSFRSWFRFIRQWCDRQTKHHGSWRDLKTRLYSYRSERGSNPWAGPLKKTQGWSFTKFSSRINHKNIDWNIFWISE